MKFLLLTLLFITSVYAGTGAIPSGANIKLLKDNLRFKSTDTKIMTNDSDDPSAVAKDAEVGSLYIQSGSGALFRKTDSGSSTNWVSLLTSSVGAGTDDCVARWTADPSSDLQDSVFCVTDGGSGYGLLSLLVDNITISNNSIDSTGDIVFDASGDINFSNLTASRPLKLNASNNLISSQIELDNTSDVTNILLNSLGGTGLDSSSASNGQLLIGNGSGFTLANILGTANQVNVDNSAGGITLSLGQDLTTDSSPTFTNATFSDLTNSQFVKTNGAGQLTSVASIDLTTDVIGILPAANGGSGLDGSSAANGSLLIGNGSGYSLSTLTGTANQINITNSAGGITLSLGQDLTTDSTPTFDNIIFSALNPTSVTYVSGSNDLSTDAGFTYASSILNVPSLLADATVDATNVAAIAQVSGATGSFTTSADVANIHLETNTISATNTNGDLILSPDGTGDVIANSPLTLLEVTEPTESPASGNVTYYANSSTGRLHYKDTNGVDLPVDRQRLADLVQDGSFEKRYSGNELGSFWNLNVGTADLSTDAYQGSQSLKISLIAQTLDLSTDAFACDQFNNKFVGFSCAIKSQEADATADLKVCSIRGNSEQSCISYDNSGNWVSLIPGFFGLAGETCKLQVKTATDMTGDVLVDNCKFEETPNGKSFKTLVQTLRHTATQSGLPSDTTEIRLESGLTTSDFIGDPLMRIEDDASNTRTKFVATGDITSHVVIQFQNVNSGANIAIYLNGTSIMPGDQAHTATTFQNAQVNVKMSEGDFLSFYTSDTLTGAGNYHITITNYAEEEGTIVPIGLDPNRYGLTVVGSNGDTSSDYPLNSGITSTRVNTGYYHIDYSALNLMSNPTVMASIDGKGFTNPSPGLDYTITVADSSTDGAFVLIEYAPSGANSDVDFNVEINKTGKDYNHGSLLGSVPHGQVCVIKDVKADGVSSGTFTSGAWRTRDLNTTEGVCSFVQLDSNQFTLAPGRYYINYLAPAYRVDTHAASLYNVTDANYDSYGTAVYVQNSVNVGNNSIGKAVLEFSTSKTFELRHYGQTTFATDGFGVRSVATSDEIFATVVIRRMN